MRPTLVSNRGSLAIFSFQVSVPLSHPEYMYSESVSAKVLIKRRVTVRHLKCHDFGL